MTGTDVVLRHHDAASARPMLDDLVEVYLEVYAHEADDPFYGEDRYRRQITGHMKSPGWEMVTATAGEDGELAGYIYGTPLPAGTGRWKGLTTPLPDDFINETGHRTFAIAELLVRKPWRRHGIARRLHDELLDHRPEERARLLVLPDNTTAQAIYTHWGWHKVATLRPSWENAPLFDVLILPCVPSLTRMATTHLTSASQLPRPPTLVRDRWRDARCGHGPVARSFRSDVSTFAEQERMFVSVEESSATGSHAVRFVQTHRRSVQGKMFSHGGPRRWGREHMAWTLRRGVVRHVVHCCALPHWANPARCCWGRSGGPRRQPRDDSSSGQDNRNARSEKRRVRHQLDVAAYDRLRQGSSPGFLVLVVVHRRHPRWTGHYGNGSIVRATAYWSKLAGLSETMNTATVTVSIPSKNLLTPTSLLELFPQGGDESGQLT